MIQSLYHCSSLVVIISLINKLLAVITRDKTRVEKPVCIIFNTYDQEYRTSEDIKKLSDIWLCHLKASS